jgi:hypothetical protein
VTSGHVVSAEQRLQGRYVHEHPTARTQVAAYCGDERLRILEVLDHVVEDGGVVGRRQPRRAVRDVVVEPPASARAGGLQGRPVQVDEVHGPGAGPLDLVPEDPLSTADVEHAQRGVERQPTVGPLPPGRGQPPLEPEMVDRGEVVPLARELHLGHIGEALDAGVSAHRRSVPAAPSP